MKATIDIPEILHRQVKARAALEGRAIRDVTIELYERWLADATAPTAPLADPSDAATAWLYRWDELGEEIARRAVDPRTSRDILLVDRR